MRIILIRHGTTQWNQERRIQGGGSDTELNETGKEQIENLARLLKEETITAIYSSPLKRALDTAKAISQYHAAEVTVVPDLRELDVGDFEGMPLTSFSSTLDQFLLDWQEGDGSARLPNGESLTDLTDRTWAFVDNINDNEQNRVVVIVSHYFTILTIICRALKLPLTHLKRLRLNAGGISILDFRDGTARLVVLNDTCHLTSKA